MGRLPTSEGGIGLVKNTRDSIRTGLRRSSVAVLSTVIVSVGTGFSAAAIVHRSPSIPKLHWKGTITMYAQAYTPVAPGVKLVKGTPRLTEFETLAKQFEKMYPGIKIQFIGPSFQDTIQQVETKAAGGDMYDVYMNQYYAFNSVFPRGVVYNLDPYFNQPNPYIPGNKRWKSVMSARVLQQTVDPANGAHYLVDGDWVGTAFYYNKKLFANPTQVGALKPSH